MKMHAIGLSKWIALGGVLVAIGVLTAIGAGRTRGSRAYGWRIALWSLAVAMMSGGMLYTGQARAASTHDAASAASDRDNVSADNPEPKCYKPAPPIKTCYRRVPVPEDPDYPDAPPDKPTDKPTDDPKDEPKEELKDAPEDGAKLPAPTCYSTPPPPEKEPPPPPKPEPDTNEGKTPDKEPEVMCYYF